MVRRRQFWAGSSFTETTCTEIFFVTVSPPCVKVTGTVLEPAIVGVPLITPAEVIRESPNGRELVGTDHEEIPDPPWEVSVTVYAVPTVATGIDVVVIESGVALTRAETFVIDRNEHIRIEFATKNFLYNVFIYLEYNWLFYIKIVNTFPVWGKIRLHSIISCFLSFLFVYYASYEYSSHSNYCN